MAEGEERRRRRRRPRRRGRNGPAGGARGAPARAGEAAAAGESPGGPGPGRPGAERARGRRGRPRPRARQSRQRGRPRRERFGEHWWAQRWIEVLEGFDVGRRLGRGRTYARSGQVIDLEIGKGFVTAKVQGSRDAPYLVRMRLSMLSTTDWKKVTRALGEHASLAAALLGGELPQNIEDVFADFDLSLFPAASGDLKTACSCPDSANPCKHVAAVYYTLAEEFDRDPFLIFRLRGLDRSELLQAVRESAARARAAAATAAEPDQSAGPDEVGATSAEAAPREERTPEAVAEPAEAEAPPAPIRPTTTRSAARVDAEQAAAHEATAPPAPHPEARRDQATPREACAPRSEPLPADPDAFWSGAEGAWVEPARVRVPEQPGALTLRLGGFPFWRGEADPVGTLERIYRNASIAGLDIFLGEPEAREAEGS
jgi:uncharacterized Zn finger protein